MHMWNMKALPFPTKKLPMIKVKVFEKYVKLQGKGHKVQTYATWWKVLSQKGTCGMWKPLGYLFL